MQAMNNDGSFGDVFKSFQSDLEQVLEQALGFRVKEMIEAHAQATASAEASMAEKDSALALAMHQKATLESELDRLERCNE